MSVLEKFEPKEAFFFFEELCSIPHGSRNMKPISDYCVKFAIDRGLEVIRDEYDNVIIIKEATEGYETEEPIILQGHLDMVCVKVPGSDFDFYKDPLQLETDGEWIWAKDTSLGGDDGIAIAMALAILDSKVIQHPRIEAVFTVDEEVGLIGADKIDLSMLKGKKLINIDSEEDDQILTSCAGGISAVGELPISRNEMEGMVYSVEISGLLGGHSGVEIHKQRGNANVLMGRILWAIKDCAEIVEITGGTAQNVIPRSCVAKIVVHLDKEVQMIRTLEILEKEIRNELNLIDDGFKIILDKTVIDTLLVMNSTSKVHTINALINVPNGVQTMSASIENLVETSMNLGIVRTDSESVRMEYSIRSSKETAKNYLFNRIKSIIEVLGGTVIEEGNYPGWEYKVDSKLRESVVKVYTNLFDEEPHVSAIHAGLECGLLSAKIEGLDCISIGPNLIDVHSVNERMEIKSVNKIWKFLMGIISEKE